MSAAVRTHDLVRSSSLESALRPVPIRPEPAGEPAVDVLLQYLAAEGVRFIFCIPGGLVYPLMAATEAHPTIELVMAKHEEGAAFMADGYARVTRGLGVCAGTSGPGATNLLTGVACAFADGVPLLVITGQANSHSLGKGAAQETPREDIDVVEMFRPVTKYSAMVTSPESLGHHVRRAIRLALSGRHGPVHLNIPVDMWDKRIKEAWFDPETYRSTSHGFDREAVRRAGDLLLSARKPVLLVGSGVGIANAEEHVRALAELLNARVATTPRGKGLFPEDDPRSLGVLGTAGHRDARDAVFGGEADVLFTIGASLGETSTSNWTPRLVPRSGLIQLDVDPDRIGRNYAVTVALVGDAQSILIELVYHLHRSIREGSFPTSEWGNAAPLVRGHDRYDQADLRTSDAVPLKPARWRVDLDAALPDDAIVFSDIGAHMLFNIHHLCIKKGQRFIINMGFGSMGHGTVAAIGAAMAEPSRPVFAIVGDGCFTMNGMELLTAAEFGVPVIWIVENNNAHNITWHGSKHLSKGRGLSVARYRRSLEVASIARAMGVHAWVVDKPGQLSEVVAEALSLRRPALIEVRVDAETPPPLGDRLRTLAGFIEE
jgi:acetolactate synthase-1/2/3 large subunit